VIFLDVINRSRFGAMHSWSAADGGHVIWPKQTVARLGIVAEHGLEYGQMRISPDGTRIAIRTIQQGQTGIAIASWTGTSIGEDVDLVLIPGHIWDFDWSPDSTRVAAVVVDDSTAEIQVLGQPTTTGRPWPPCRSRSTARIRSTPWGRSRRSAGRDRYRTQSPETPHGGWAMSRPAASSAWR